ncbi:MAG: putative manganese-dependent inorganic diphosphatase [Lachnospiraceae bacterium]|nr:putative manganese-dependent inorganic diphosphatase [Lachnospiraceae bacterium]MBO5146348.1 putative manganese-dependent inorganic diphosphatase [Lachnospiraceae bacterium]
MDNSELTKRPVYIVGHKNPDTDSICSAIAYAYLKNECDKTCRYIPARAGQVNQETQYVLNAFHAEPPIYLHDVMTDARDIDMNDVEGVTEDVSLKKAWHLMRDRGDVTVPVIAQEKLTGIITIGDIANAYMDVYDNGILSRAKTSYKNILETLDAQMLVGDENGYFESGEVVIATANPDVLEDYIHSGDMVILGNRYETQLCAIEMGAACVIVTMGAKISKTIQIFAKEHNCILINTPYDTATVARLINQSMPIGYFMRRDKLTTFKITDKTEDIRAIMKKKRYHDFPVLDEEDRYVGMISRRTLLNLRKKQLILVDHNELSQTVDGIEFADILEIIDHHRIGTLETVSPVFFRNQPLGCTATIIYQMYQEKEIEIPKNIAGLMMSAIISDTLMFHSPTVTEIDKAAAQKLSEICGIEIEEFAIDMFGAGSNLSDKEADEIFKQDYKNFSVNGFDFGVGQINSMNSIELEEIKEKIEPYVREHLPELPVDMCFFMLTNIVYEKTELLCFGDRAEELVREAFRLPKNQKKFELKNLVSRKKQLIPAFVSILQQWEK